MTDLCGTKSTEVKVLLLAPNWLGDAVMFSALLSFLDRHRQLPDGRCLTLDLAIQPAWSPLFQGDSRLRKIFSVVTKTRHGGFLGGFRLGADLRGGGYAAVVLGPPSLRAGLAAWRSGAAVRIGYKNDSRGFLLTHARDLLLRGKRHHSQEFVQLGRDLLQVFASNQANDTVSQFLPHLPACECIPAVPRTSENPIWLFALGTTYGSAKNWPQERALDFLRKALNEYQAQVVLLGDKSASDGAHALASSLDLPLDHQMTSGSRLVDLTGKTDLLQVVSLMKACQVFVGNDSGLMHLSAALGRPTVGLFGSSNPLWTRPLGPRTRVVSVEGFSCHPCYLKTCPKVEFCLDTLSADQVLEAIDDLLSVDLQSEV